MESIKRAAFLAALLCLQVGLSLGYDVPAVFAFGDSLVDTGNNEHLLTAARANYPPYGVSLPSHIPTGRFCDGQVVVDLIASYMNLTSPPFFAGGADFHRGANFGSASSGILPTTAMPGALPLGRQVSAFYSARIPFDIASKSIFYLCTGNNDINNYYNSHFRTVPVPFRTQLLIEFARQIERLYGMGARKFAIVGLSSFGCIPMNNVHTFGACDPTAVRIAGEYNAALAATIERLRYILPGAHFVITNFSGLALDANENPQRYGFIESSKACCSIGNGVTCTPGGTYCSVQSKYAYWDDVHNTEAFNKIAAEAWWSGSSESVFPMNIQQLAAV